MKLHIDYRDGNYSLFDPCDYYKNFTEADFREGHYIEIPDHEWALYQAFIATCRAWDQRIAQLDNEMHERRQEKSNV